MYTEEALKDITLYANIQNFISQHPKQHQILEFVWRASLPQKLEVPPKGNSFWAIALQGRQSGPKSGGGVGMNGAGGVGVFDKSAPVNCKADRLSAFCTSRAKMSAIRTRHDKTTLLVTKGDNGHFRTLRAITYKKILNKSNAILAACLHLLATFGLECWAFACKNNTICKKVALLAPPRPPPMS